MNKIFFIFCWFWSMAFFSQERSYRLEDWGIRPDASCSVTASFDRAVDFICKNGGRLKIPKGRYILDGRGRVREGVNRTSYIFLTEKSFQIEMDPEAVLVFKNNFEGFRFRTVTDPNENTVNSLSVEISGGRVLAEDNFRMDAKNNPMMWGFVGETLDEFTVRDLQVESFYGSAAIACYSSNFARIERCVLLNVTGNPNDLVDNHGDGIYVANVLGYTITDNTIRNTITKERRIGRIGVCIEYEKSGNGLIRNNQISGYDRGIHVELIKGTATVMANRLIDNSSGIVLWSNYGYPQIIQDNVIKYAALPKDHFVMLYASAPILMLGYEGNRGSHIVNNRIEISKDGFLPNDILQVTSSDTQVLGNEIDDASQSLVVAVQGKATNERIFKVRLVKNIIKAKALLSYDATEVHLLDNVLEVSEVTAAFDDSDNRFMGNKIVGRIPKSNLRFYGTYRFEN
ncbi:right-handed parallel beta-helix repeat-containing protein [Riemerella anatipestifer]|nr:right-handed parallel beta-helix repeat-containing protein [Riemerella anatipestifer]